MRAKRLVGEGPTLAGSGRCREYIDETVCKADATCNWRKGYTTVAGGVIKPLCVVRGHSRIINPAGTGRGTGTEAQKAAAAASPWIQRVKTYAAANNVSYKEAMVALKGTGGGKGAMKGGYYY